MKKNNQLEIKKSQKVIKILFLKMNKYKFNLNLLKKLIILKKQ